MPAKRVQSIVIVGGGAAGWLAAATLARRLKRNFCGIRLIETADASFGGFSEVALPSFHRLNGLLGINECDLLQRTLGTFSLGARYADWGRPGERYFHTFGTTGFKLDAVPFHHYWLKLRESGQASAFDDYSTAAAAAEKGRFAPPVADRASVLSTYAYGYHFQAGLLADYLCEYAQSHGVVRVAREIVDVQLKGEDGFIDSLQLDDGTRVAADLFIDCGGRQGIVSQRMLHRGYEDWSHWLPCNRSVSVLAASSGEPEPYALATAQSSGWGWNVPLRQCTDSGRVYCDRHSSDDETVGQLLSQLNGPAIGDPRVVQLSPGRPKKYWDRNCVILADGGLERLESTGLHRVQTGITRLLTLFPVGRFSPVDTEEYNRLSVMESERIRDFLILHYKATTRDDSPFWQQCRRMAIPDSLQAKIELFKNCGRIAMFDEEHFGEESWLALLLGQGMYPEDYDPLADMVDAGAAREALSRMKSLIQAGIATLPTLSKFMADYCPAAPENLDRIGNAHQ